MAANYSACSWQATLGDIWFFSASHCIKVIYWHQKIKMKIVFMKILRADYMWGMPATIQFRISLSSCLLSKKVKIKIQL